MLPMASLIAPGQELKVNSAPTTRSREAAKARSSPLVPRLAR
jgi:hypothetical protein